MKISAIPASGVPSMDASSGAMQQQQTMHPSHVDRMKIRMNVNKTPLSAQQFAPQSGTSSPDVNKSNPENETQEGTNEATSEPLSPQLALLARQRRALQREREVLNKEKALLAQASGNSGSTIDAARLKSEPLSVLLENGVTYDQLTQAIMAGQGNSELNALKAEIESLKEGIDKKFTEKDVQARVQILAEMRREADSLIRNGDDYELVREMRQVPNVMKLIERTYDETGEILDVPEACRLIEEELFKDAQRISNLKKMQSQIKGNMALHFQPQQRPSNNNAMTMRTLTNRDTASQVPLSAKARAMAAFYGTQIRR